MCFGNGKNFSDRMDLIIAIIVIVLFLVAVVWWERYKYIDCKKVGHSTVYCLGALVNGKR